MSEIKQGATIDAETRANVDRWLRATSIDEKTKAEVRYLQENDPQELVDAFYTRLSFGTGGLRGTMGIGSNRMNIYTIRAATQGLANYINSVEGISSPSVAIAFDSRHFSTTFAEEAAKVLAGNDIHVYLFDALRPTPLLSFAVREKGCTAGIMVTASHNAAKYNGYKVYWNDGAQVLPPHDVGIIDEVEKIDDFDQIKWVGSLEDPHIERLGEEIDTRYLEAIRPLQNFPELNAHHGSEVSVVYTGLHGTGFTLVPPALADWGFTNVFSLPEQNQPDGNFPTVKLPNPEYSETLTLGTEALKEHEGDLLIATDPDADRMGVAVRHNGSITQLNGNQIASLCLDHICRAQTQSNTLPDNAAFVKTIVTTELFRAICDAYHRPCFDVLTGFKYIAEKIRQWESEPHGLSFLFGGEESYGYLYGTHARDKDAVICSALLCELALTLKRQGKTLVDRLEELYVQHGVFAEELYTLNFPETREGREAMAAVMPSLRTRPLQRMLNTAIVSVEDYTSQTRTFIKTGKTESIKLPPSNVLLYHFEDGTKVVVRPSGTEPKVKLYCGVVAKEFSTVTEGETKARRRAHDFIEAFKGLIEGTS